ncbi:MAG: TRAP transporter large permease subunit, partial [Gemmatimonadota bacterium]
MTLPISGLIGIAAMFALLMFGVPIAFSMAITGAVGLWMLEGPGPALAHSLLVPWSEGRSFVFVTIPLFVLMGQLVFHTGLATDLYGAVRTWIGKVPGGMAITSVVACGAFGAVTGSSIATVATMGAIVMPEMRRYNYNPRLATGALAASGTLGILIPPSVIFIFYGVMTETSIGALFIAGIVPGILTAAMFSIIILLRCVLTPSLGPPGPGATWSERWSSTAGLVPIMLLFGLVIGGIYAGVFTPTEAAGVGCSGVLITAAVRRSLTRTAMSKALEETALISAMIFAIIVGGYLFARFLAVTGTTQAMVQVLVDLNLGRVMFLVLLVGLYIVLGAMLDVFGMLVLTIPFVMPVVLELGI